MLLLELNSISKRFEQKPKPRVIPLKDPSAGFHSGVDGDQAGGLLFVSAADTFALAGFPDVPLAPCS